MRVVIRTDGSRSLGIGHVVRCLALADGLRRCGASVEFVTREHDSNVCEFISARGFPAHRVAGTNQTDAWQADAEETLHFIKAGGAVPDWLVVDHYRISEPWEASLRAHVKKIMVIDDLADRPHDCDVILDQNFYENMTTRYEQLVPERSFKALGPTFALLRPEFYDARKKLRARNGALARVLIAFGGSDPTNETAKVLEALERPAFRELQIDVIIGSINVCKKDLFARYATDPRIRFHENTTDVAALMMAADLSIGGGGTMNWERCHLGLPAIVIVVAENQAETSGALHGAGAILSLGWHAQVSSAQIAATVAMLAADPQMLNSLSRCSMAVMSPGGTPPTQIRILETLLGGKLWPQI